MEVKRMAQEQVFTVEYNAKVHLTAENIDDIMVCALEGGINYWCRKVKVVGEYFGEYASEQISRGGSLVLYDAESSDKWELTRDKFLKGFQLWLENDTDTYYGVDEHELDTSVIDGTAADFIVQYALFGEVVFG